MKGPFVSWGYDTINDTFVLHVVVPRVHPSGMSKAAIKVCFEDVKRITKAILEEDVCNIPLEEVDR